MTQDNNTTSNTVEVTNPMTNNKSSFLRELLKDKQLKFMGIAIIALILIAFFIGGITRTIQYIDSMKRSIVEKIDKQERHIDNLKAGISQDNIRRRNIIATEQIIAKANNELPYEARLEYASYFVDEVERMPGVDLSLALAVATTESSFNPKAKSYIEINGVKKINAVGIFQFVGLTGKNIAHELGIPYGDSTRYDPRLNIKMGIYYIQQLLNEYDNNTEMALAHFMDGNNGADSWSLRNKLSTNKEYIDIDINNIKHKLRVLGYGSDTVSDTPEITKYIQFAKAKGLPLQTELGVPKIIRKRNEYLEYFRDADIYFTPTTKAVVDLNKTKQKVTK
jgi:hypothetical protein